MAQDIVSLGYAEIRSKLEALDEAFAAGTLTEKALSDAIRLIYWDPADGPAESLGVKWMFGMISQTKADETLPLASILPDPLAFFRAHLDVSEFTRFAISRPPVFRLVPEEARADFVRDAFLANGAWRCWVRSAREVGIPADIMEEAVLSRLRQSVPDRELKHNVATYSRDFVSYGAGSEARFGLFRRDESLSWKDRWVTDDEWSVFQTKERFLEAIEICLDKCPASFLEAELIVSLKEVLGDEVRSIIKRAIESVGRTPPAVHSFRLYWPVNERKELCALVKAECAGADEARFIIDTATEDGGEPAFIRTMLPKLAKVDAATLYRQVAQIADEKEGRGWVPTEFVTYALARLKEDGYLMGRVTRGEFVRRGVTQHQYELRVGDSVYVQDRMQHRYFPYVGAVVMVRAKSAISLAVRGRTRVFTAAFRPVKGREE
ncbi:MAG TPA: hypothetical protein VFQ60_03550 [Patescibacteria group bacterium]|nr:hypothetical protein [Patescibacteria group bacterium]